MDENLYRLVYCSRNAISDGQGNVARDVALEVARILQVSKRNNARDGITGALLFTTGCFAQVLEGPRPTLERTFERIQWDPRHSDVTLLSLAPAPARDFGAWSMAYAGPQKPASSAATRLSRAIEVAGEQGAAMALDTLRDLVERQSDWVRIPG